MDVGWKEIIGILTFLVLNFGGMLALTRFMSNSFNNRFNSLESSLNKRIDELRDDVRELRNEDTVTVTGVVKIFEGIKAIKKDES